MRRLLACCTALLAVASLGFVPALAPATAPALAPGTAPETAPETATDAAELVSDTSRTIVVFNDHVTDVAATTQRLLTPLGLTPVHLYAHALQGFAVEARPEDLTPIADDPAVAYLEADREVRTAAQTIPSGVRRVDAVVAAAGIGSGNQVPVDIAIIDTGIASHSDLRVVERLDCTNRSIEPTVEYVEFLVFGSCKQGGSDNDGHGTHVAGIVAARDNSFGVVGVAPGARLWAIKVINKTSGGSLSDVVAGVDEVARRGSTIEVANISLVADGRSSAMDDAIAGATSAGVVVVVAAGNGAKNASSTTPANSPRAITVSAVTDLDGLPGGQRQGDCNGGDDRFATYSNYGSVVDIAAPGSCITSTARGGGYQDMSGTSMATPHVAGAAALRIHQRGLSATSGRWSTVRDDLLSTSAAHGTSCGYTGSPSKERLLDLRKGC